MVNAKKKFSNGEKSDNIILFPAARLRSHFVGFALARYLSVSPQDKDVLFM
jgi:hypothetical protein